MIMPTFHTGPEKWHRVAINPREVSTVEPYKNTSVLAKITMTNGEHHVVSDSIAEVVAALARAWRG